jgi:uncharacterized protein YdhG (YjbR/CyaY superfamily)
MSPKKANKKAAKSTPARKAGKFTSEEMSAMRARARELKAQAEKEEGEGDAVASINSMAEPDRSMARRIHAIIKANAPGLSAKTWYGMPAYADREGKIICFFQTAAKFKTRYCTFGFNDAAHLDDGLMWPVAFALQGMTSAEEARITALVKKAAG